MGICSLLMGTLCIVLLQFTPADTWQSDKQLVGKSQLVVTVDQFRGSIVMQEKASATAGTTILVPVNQSRGRVKFVEEDEGNIQDGYTLHEPAPT